MKRIYNLLSASETAYLLAFVAVLLLMLGCNSELDGDRVARNDSFVKVQVMSDGVVYADGSGEVHREQRIDNVLALVFTEDQEFAYVAESSVPKLVKSNMYEFDVALRFLENNQKSQLVLLANTPDHKKNLSRYVGMSKQKLLEQFKYDSSCLANGEDYKLHNEEIGIPMYGQSNMMQVNASTKITPITMMRAVAKVDIFLKKKDISGSLFDKMEEGSAANYLLEEVHLFNSLSAGRIAPRFEETKEFNWASYEATTPSMLLDMPDDEKYNGSIKLLYKATTNTKGQSIYLSENVGGYSAEKEGVTTFILGLRESSKLLEPTKPIRYYRLDIVNRNNEEIIDPIVRNKHYQILLKDINTQGSETVEDAVASTAECTITMVVKDWVTERHDWDIVGSDFFEVSDRKLFFPTKGVQEITYKTNLDPSDIKLSWSADAGEADRSLFLNDKNHHIKIVNDDKGNTTIRVEAKNENAANLNSVLREFYIYAGRMVVPVEIQQRIPTVKMTKLDPITECLPYGYYIKGKELDGNKSYLELKVPLKFQYHESTLGLDQARDFNIELGDKISANGEAVGFSSSVSITMRFTLEDYEIKYENLIEEKDEDGNMQRFVVVRIPAKGKPINISTQEEYTQDFKVDFTIKKVYGDFTAEQKTRVKVDVTKTEPEFEYVPKILVVGESYSFNPTVINSYLLSMFYDVNIAKILLNPGVFGMHRNSEVKVEPYIYTEEIDGVTYQRTRNLKKVDSFRDLGSPAELEKYDIVLFLNSSEVDELIPEDNIYARTLERLVRNKQIALIQTPTRETALPFLVESYLDPMFGRIIGEKETFRVGQSSRETQMALSVILDSAIDKEFFIHYEKDLPARISRKIFFPSRDKKSLLRFANVFASFRDTNYLPSNNRAVEPLAHYDLRSIGYRPVMARAKDYPYLWLGNTSIFADAAVAVDASYPTSARVDTFDGYSDKILKETTYNAYFFVEVMYWAMKQVQHKAKN